MFLEYDWTFNVYRTRLGNTFIAWRDFPSFPSFAEAKYEIEAAGCRIGKKVASRSWHIENAHAEAE